MALDAGKVVAILELDTSKFSGGISTAKSLMAKLKDDSVSISDKLKAIGGTMTSVGKIASTSLTLPIVAAGAAAVHTFTSFDDAMRQVQATMGLTSENGAAEIQKLTEAAQEMGATTRYTASQAAEALNYLALAGYDANKAIGALPTVLRLAQAGGMDLGYASDLVTDSMSALGLETSQLTQFVDEMAKTSQKSNTNIAQLGEAILTVGGTAKSLKGGTVELSTALGILADNGIKGAEGGTALRNILLALKTPTADAERMLKQYGIAVYDAQGNMRGLEEIFGDIAITMDGWTQEQRDSLFTTLFNKRDLKSAEALIANYGDRWQELSGYIADSSGAAEQMAGTMEGGIGGSFRSLSSAVEGLAIEFGENLAPTVQQVADFVTNMVRGFAALPEATQTSIVSTAAWVAAAGPMLLIGGKLVSTIGALASVLTGPGALVAGLVAGGVALAAIAGNMDSVSSTIDRSLENMDPRELKSYNDAFAAINTEITLDATVTDNTMSTVDGAVSSLKARLLALDVLTDGERDEIVSLIGQDVDPIIQALTGAGIDATTEEGAGVAADITQASIDLHLALVAATKVGAGMNLPSFAEAIQMDKDALITALTSQGIVPEDAQSFADQVESAKKVLEDAGVSAEGIDLSGAIAAANGDKQALLDALMAKGVEPALGQRIYSQMVVANGTLTKAAEAVDTASLQTIAAAAQQGKEALVKALTEQFVAGGVEDPEGQAETAATQIIAAMDALSAACAGANGLVPADIAKIVAEQKSNLVTALSGLELTEDEIATIIAPYTSATSQISAGVTSVYDTIFGKLTDGAPDTEAQKEELKAQVQTYYDDLMSGLDLSTDAGAGYAADLQSLMDETFAFIDEMSGKGTAVVQANAGELNALAAQAMETAGKIAALTAQSQQTVDDLNVRMVRAGVTTNAQKVAGAFEVTYQAYGQDVAAIRENAKRQREEADKAWLAAYTEADKKDDSAERAALKNAADEQYQERLDAIEEGQEGAEQRAQAQYKDNLNKLFQGLATAWGKENPEGLAILEEAYENIDLRDKLQEILQKKLAADEAGIAYDGADFTPEILKALGVEGEFDPAMLSGYLAAARMKITELTNGEINDLSGVIGGMDTGPLASSFAGLMEQGLLEGVEGINTSTLEGALALMLGKLSVPEVSPVPAADGGKAGSETGMEYASGVESASGDAQSAGSAVADSAASGLSSGAGAAKNAGANVGAGFVSGMQSKLSAAINQAKALVRAAIDAMNQEADSHSPSRKAMKSGGWVSQGYAIGLRSHITDVMSASHEIARAGLSSLNGNFEGGGGSAARAAAGNSITLNVNNPVVRSNADVRNLSREMNRYAGQLQYGYGGRL